jgi:hypothetical protein
MSTTFGKTLAGVSSSWITRSLDSPCTCAVRGQVSARGRQHTAIAIAASFPARRLRRPRMRLAERRGAAPRSPHRAEHRLPQLLEGVPPARDLLLAQLLHHTNCAGLAQIAGQAQGIW